MSYIKRKSNLESERSTNKKLKLTSPNEKFLKNFDVHRNIEDTKVLNAFAKHVTQNTNMEKLYQLTKFSGKCM